MLMLKLNCIIKKQLFQKMNGNLVCTFITVGKFPVVLGGRCNPG